MTVKNPRHRFVNGLIVFSFLFATACLLFIFSLSCVFKMPRQILFFYICIVSFIVGISSGFGISYCKGKLDFIVDYGDPILQASNTIKEIIRNANVYGVKSLSVLVEKEVKKKLNTVIRKEVGK